MKKDWIECTLDDFFILITNGSSIKQDNEPTGVPISRIETIWNGSVDFSRVKYVTAKVDSSFIEKYSLKLNDILFSHINSDSHLGKTAIFKNIGKTLLHGINLLLLRSTPLINASFILYFLKYSKVNGTFLTIAQRSVNQSSINQRALKKLQFIFPTFPEQRAIVKKIEQLFSDLDATIADLKKTQEQLKTYRQAVLKKAFEGNWGTKALGTIAEVKRGKSKHRPRNDKKLFGGPYPFIQTGEVRKANGGIIKSYESTYSEFGLQQSKLWPKGTLCLTIAANIGETAFLGFDACFPDSVVGIKTDESILSLNYFNYFIQFTKSEIDRKASATAQKNINVEFLEALEIPLPTPEKQYRIVREIESCFSVCDAVEQQIRASLDKAEALLQSILKKAFAGALLNHAELEACRREPDYEPAAILLEKIKADKANGKPKTSKQLKKQIPVAAPVVAVPKISTDIQAGLIAKVIHLHEQHPEQLHLLSHIKCEKLSHLVESHLQIPLGRQPVKDAAGPDDYPRLKKVEHRAKMAGYFAVQKNKIGHTYLSGKNLDKAISMFENGLSVDQKNRVNQLLALFLKFDLERAEIVATVYAAWNNLIITGNTHPTEMEIVQEARYNWSDRKLTLEESWFYNAIQWMRKEDINLVPVGYGVYVDFPKKKK